MFKRFRERSETCEHFSLVRSYHLFPEIWMKPFRLVHYYVGKPFADYSKKILAGILTTSEYWKSSFQRKIDRKKAVDEKSLNVEILFQTFQDTFSDTNIHSRDSSTFFLSEANNGIKKHVPNSLYICNNSITTGQHKHKKIYHKRQTTNTYSLVNRSKVICHQGHMPGSRGFQ